MEIAACVWRHTCNRPYVDSIDKMTQYKKTKIIFLNRYMYWYKVVKCTNKYLWCVLIMKYNGQSWCKNALSITHVTGEWPFRNKVMEQIRKITKIFQNLEKSVRAGTRNTSFFFFYLALPEKMITWHHLVMILLLISLKTFFEGL